ncbi:L,D-transpeptidase family protein [Methylomonas sp. SURF-1]|uniref:L,D-transpeptidase family protein n=1 Tax=Methylomonas aurea TaxID=2952224 RepID=A0ABT1UD85_9GAMM|nr:L,D-transpeptidase family protein [Methylomonas sp. SURF-1]MCQ8180189.1 L,D-transpeptidase family protein [Methylomonas sp. SURF-1]
MFRPNSLFRFMPRLLAVLLICHWAVAGADEAETGKAVEALLNGGRLPLLARADIAAQSPALARLYRANANRLLWFGDANPAQNREQALAVLRDAAAEGLDPRHYDAERLAEAARQAAAAPADVVAGYDLALTVALLRYAGDLHSGRVDPRKLDYPAQLGASRAQPDLAGVLQHHLQMQTLAQLPAELAPNNEQYRLLKRALADYRRRLAEAGTNPGLVFAKSLHPGDRDSQVPELRRRLRELGEPDIPAAADADKAADVYDDASVAAVKRIQERQGLKADGVIGRQTLALLNQSVPEKIAAIELAMERIRWLPEAAGGPHIVVNIPAFQLWAFKDAQDEQPLRMKVIVGKAPENLTPMLAEDMKYLEFMPYWNIPKSIMDKEILPKLEGDEAFLDDQDIELVERYSDDEQAEDVVADLRQGRLRARQRPGAKNPLGRVKFVFPNKADVYLHDTPGKAAFNRDRRDLSHGCVRVAEAEKLAEFVLDGQEGWSPDSIRQAMAGPKTQRVSLKKSVPVLFFYATAFVDRDGKPRFYPDIYGYDAALRNALNKLAPDTGAQLTSKGNATSGG